jgi:tetratricopeptide (TPR) repeat protein
MSLNNLSIILGGQGRREEALAAIEEAVELYRGLAVLWPDAFRPALAMSLNNLSNRLTALGWREEALTVAKEAIGILAAYFRALPDAFRERMGKLVGTYRELLEQTGREADPDLDPVLGEFGNG